MVQTNYRWIYCWNCGHRTARADDDSWDNYSCPNCMSKINNPKNQYLTVTEQREIKSYIEFLAGGDDPDWDNMPKWILDLEKTRPTFANSDDGWTDHKNTYG